jgi:hypothetical protein
MLVALGAGQGARKGSGVMFTWPGFRARPTIVVVLLPGAGFLLPVRRCFVLKRRTGLKGIDHHRAIRAVLIPLSSRRAPGLCSDQTRRGETGTVEPQIEDMDVLLAASGAEFRRALDTSP